MDIVVRILLILLGYISGSVLYAEIAVRMVKGESLTEISENHNPGTSNAFHYGGVLSGTIAVAGDLLKGIIPVWVYVGLFGYDDALLAGMIWAPVLGHAFSCFYKFNGGMCIATSFGGLIGLFPMWQPLVTLVVLFLLSLLIPRVHNSIKTIAVFILLMMANMIYLTEGWITIPVLVGVVGISILVCARMKVDLHRRGLR